MSSEHDVVYECPLIETVTAALLVHTLTTLKLECISVHIGWIACSNIRAPMYECTFHTLEYG